MAAAPAARSHPKEEIPMSIDENKAIFRRLIEELWNQGNLDLADELFTADAFSPSAPDLPPGPQGTKVIAAMFLKAFPDLHITIEHEVADGDRVFGHLRQRGTHTGPLVTPAGVVPATGKAVDFNEMAIVRIVDGRIAESWYDTDMVGMLMQIGVIPTPEPAPAG
jgi:predicted ester cyclase